MKSRLACRPRCNPGPERTVQGGLRGENEAAGVDGDLPRGDEIALQLGTQGFVLRSGIDRGRGRQRVPACAGQQLVA